jgi:hypothetical protein
MSENLMGLDTIEISKKRNVINFNYLVLFISTNMHLGA